MHQLKTEMVQCGRHATPHSSQQTPSPFAFSHPLVYAVRVEDSVQALGRFIDHQLRPKIVRLREEHNCIEHQLQRTMTKKRYSAGTTTRTTNARQRQAQRLKQQAWLWKRTSKRQELNRFEPFLELATDFQKLSSDLNPNVLRLTVQWQRSQSIALHKHIAAADDGNDVVYDDNAVTGGKNDRRRCEERHRLSRDFHNACMENARVSKSIQRRIGRLTTSEAITSNVTDVASIISSLKMFSNNYRVCGTCKAMFHNDYSDALVARVPNSRERNSRHSDEISSFICIHCWNSTARTQRSLGTESGRSLFTKSLTPTSNDRGDDKNSEGKWQTTNAANDQNNKNSMFEGARWQARKKVIKNRMVAAATASNGGSSSSGTVSATIAVTTHDSVGAEDKAATSPSTLEHYIGSIPSLDDGLNRLGESLSSFGNSLLGESDQEESRRSLQSSIRSSLPSVKSTPTRSIASMNLKANTSPGADTTNNGESKTEVGKRKDGWSRYGSPASSIGSNSIVESDCFTPKKDIAMMKRAYNSSVADSNNDGESKTEESKRKDDWSRYGSQASSICSNSIVESHCFTPTKGTAAMKAKVNTLDVVERDDDGESKTEESKRKDGWSRYGSSASSIGSNSIVESVFQGSLHSQHAIPPNKPRYGMDDHFLVGKLPIKGSDSCNRFESPNSSMCSSSIFDDISAESTSVHSLRSASSSDVFESTYIKSALRKNPAPSSSSTIGSSPTKVEEFPFGSSHTRKSVRFRSPLEECHDCRVYYSMTGTNSKKASLDTSTEIVDQVEYFCRWDTFMNAFEGKAS